jgi:pimeloyl-ACP methyl ester carboxylesterase
MGERVRLGRADTGVSAHVADVVDHLVSEELEDVVLVGHSYGGYPALLAAAREAPRIRRLVLLDALVPEAGASVSSGTPAEALRAAEARLIDGFRLPPPPPEAFDVPAGSPRHAWLKRRLTTLPWRALTETVAEHSLPRGLPVSFISCANSSLPGPQLGLARARAAGWDIHELASGHDAMITEPVKLAAVLRKLGDRR